MKQRADIHVTGIVQGVGFRPFIYRAAINLSLLGYVLNLGDAGVQIVVEGDRETIEKLIEHLQSNPPSISRIDSVNVEWDSAIDSFDSFSIRKSSTRRIDESAPEMPPDIAICDDCVLDLKSSDSRWYQYPFTSCAACGPRYSTITRLPYDRPNTTMVDFPLCNVCNTGYTSPMDRRYHAQTTACDSCGPRYLLYGEDGELVHDVDSIVQAARLLEKNAVLALQGIGGTHLVTRTSDYRPIRVLRERKNRFQRPFAIMAKDADAVLRFGEPTENEMRLMRTWRRPIVLVRKRTGSTIPRMSLDEISPGLDTLGVMLPYAPLHHLLFEKLEEEALVMTSANPTGVPMYIDPQVITTELNGIADYFLLHNRRIHQRSDDSVIKFVGSDSPVFIRRARGCVPEPLTINCGPTLKVVAVGPEEKATGAVLKSKKVYMTQHIGDTDRVENIDFLRTSIDHLMFLLGIDEVDAIACDLHPEFLSTELAEGLSSKTDAPLIRVQHHHAHLAGILVDNSMDLDTSIVCITADGYGYSPDGEGWGGDILVGNAAEFVRKGGLNPSPFPGGDLSARYAARSLVGILGNRLPIERFLPTILGRPIASNENLDEHTLPILLQAMTQHINVLRSTSVGRFLDAVAVSLGVCSENSYDGECPMKLEAHSTNSDLNIESDFISNGNVIELNPAESLNQILELIREGHSTNKIAYAVHRHVGKALAEMACRIADNEGINHVGFSGGVALNRIITETLVDVIRSKGKQPLIHRHIPPGDGGISAGQVAVAAARMMK
ncbi:MAG: carbamoyltransferase HypF [Candidatus Hermodarchaeota archaeon]